MEGVLVNAKKEGSTITTSVVSNEKGEYSFPAGRLTPGKYTVSIRAGGYVLGGPKTVDFNSAHTIQCKSNSLPFTSTSNSAAHISGQCN